MEGFQQFIRTSEVRSHRGVCAPNSFRDLPDEREVPKDPPVPFDESPPHSSISSEVLGVDRDHSRFPCGSTRANAIVTHQPSKNDLDLRLRELIKDYGNPDIYADGAASKRHGIMTKAILLAFLIVLCLSPITQHNPHARTGVQHSGIDLRDSEKGIRPEVETTGAETQPLSAADSQIH